jgi:hypothetical protein
MIVSWLDHEIVWLRIEGEFLADELIHETNKWLHNHPNDFLGYIVDVRKMTTRKAAEQQKAEAAAKQNKSGKVRAVLGKDEAFSMAIKIYVRFTGAEGVRYFTDENEAREWIMSFKKIKSVMDQAESM